MHSATHNKEESRLTLTAGANSKPQPIFQADYAKKLKKKKPCGLTVCVTCKWWDEITPF
jgi:hypothetical protein